MTSLHAASRALEALVARGVAVERLEIGARNPVLWLVPPRPWDASAVPELARPVTVVRNSARRLQAVPFMGCQLQWMEE